MSQKLSRVTVMNQIRICYVTVTASCKFESKTKNLVVGIFSICKLILKTIWLYWLTGWSVTTENFVSHMLNCSIWSVQLLIFHRIDLIIYYDHNLPQNIVLLRVQYRRRMCIQHSNIQPADNKRLIIWLNNFLSPLILLSMRFLKKMIFKK